MDTPQSEDSVIPLKTTEPRGLAQSKRDDDDDDTHDRTKGWKTFAAYAGNNRDYCRQLITSTKDEECLAGSSSGMSITGGAVEREDDVDGSEDGRGLEKRGQEVDNDKKPKRKMHRASLYTFNTKIERSIMFASSLSLEKSIASLLP
ncbi:unnamed protein product [Clonostachys chloroleuca]|uniref:Uncharacterized protein n=1 Tax=Clonostachys chloroleuca TaxID=1926264 RepID=A0AA35Q5W5_9HYPO|nr:unnamed protein product [Clonostachys chloroleuca]